MYLFAESFGSSGTFLIILFIMIVGTRQWIIWLKGSAALRGAAKKGLFYGIGKIFKM
jgi:hypothetical protein